MSSSCGRRYGSRLHSALHCFTVLRSALRCYAHISFRSGRALLHVVTRHGAGASCVRVLPCAAAAMSVNHHPLSLPLPSPLSPPLIPERSTALWSCWAHGSILRGGNLHATISRCGEIFLGALMVREVRLHRIAALANSPACPDAAVRAEGPESGAEARTV